VTIPLSGSREARPFPLRRLAAWAAARDLAAFIVPGPDVARTCGIDLDAAGVRVAQTPRHAGVLVLVGELPRGLKKAAAVAYAQMPRPRAILAVGAGDVSPLPEPDVWVTASQRELAAGVEELRRLFAEGAFATEAAGFDIEEIRMETEYVCPMHPEVTSDEPGSCPKCGMDLIPRESAGGAGHEGHDDAGHGDTDHDASDPGVLVSHEGHGSNDEMDYQDMGHEGGGEDSGGHEHAERGEHEGHDEMDHGGHEDMGFMSMVEMTQGTPRSSDGLQMEWTGAPFGPLFPGLPGGLSLTFTLDGDTVANVTAPRGALGWDLDGLETAPARDFPDLLALLDPLSPTAYRLLALQALEDAANTVADERTTLERVGALERERAASHLGWFSGFGRLLGYSWLEARAGQIQLALLRAADAEEVARQETEVGKLVRRVYRTPMLARRLKGLGTLPDTAETSGPVARAAGLAKDARSGGIYRTLDFEPVVREGNDAVARLWTRLAEVEQSLKLVRKAGAVCFPQGMLTSPLGSTGSATVETPRGAATLRVKLQGDVVSATELTTPSSLHHQFIGAVAEEREVADALLGVASLDLSPWGVAR